MNRIVVAFVSAFVLIATASCTQPDDDFSEATIATLHDQMQRGEVTSEQLVRWYLARIDEIDRNGPALNAIIETNPDALMHARALDEEWQSDGPRGPLHGIPVVLKANIDTADKMMTSAGSLALADHRPPQDAFVVKQLRDAGAVILGKANLSEWANFRSSRSSSGWSSVGGQTHNPYDSSRNPCGSSSGSAVAVSANLASVAVGTETDGSVICPSGINGIVGVKPTIGLVSRSGIIPIAHTQDTAGPMARTVRDAAILLSAMSGADPQDPVTASAPQIDYAASLTADGLNGRRIGIVRSHYGAGSNPNVEALLDRGIARLRESGAEIVDDIRIDMEGVGDAEYEVLLYEFKHGLEKYFESSNARYNSLAEIIAFNNDHADRVMPIFGQDILELANSKGPLSDTEYLDALAASQAAARSTLDSVFDEHDVDALLAISNGPAWKTDHANGDSFHIGSSSYAAVSGYPSVTVPAGLASELPIGLSFIGRAFSEPELLQMAYAFEQATEGRRPPTITSGTAASQ